MRTGSPNPKPPTKQADGNWTVSGQLDASNGFGALIRQTYACDGMTLTSRLPIGDDLWQIGRAIVR